MVTTEKSKGQITEVQIKRVDLLPPSVRDQLRQEHGVVTGLVKFNITENSPKDIVSVEECFELPSDIIDRAYAKQ